MASEALGYISSKESILTCKRNTCFMIHLFPNVPGKLSEELNFTFLSPVYFFVLHSTNKVLKSVFRAAERSFVT